MSQRRCANNLRIDKRDLVPVEGSAVMALYFAMKNTSTVFFCSSGSLGLLERDILGPSEGSTPLRASSSKSMRSASLSPYVNNLNYVANAPTCTISIHTSPRDKGSDRPSMNSPELSQTVPKRWRPCQSPNRPIQLACSLPWVSSGSDNIPMAKVPLYVPGLARSESVARQ